MASGKIYPEIRISKEVSNTAFPGITRGIVTIGNGLQIVRFYGTTTASINAWAYTEWPAPTTTSKWLSLKIDSNYFYIESTASNYRNLKTNNKVPSGTNVDVIILVYDYGA